MRRTMKKTLAGLVATATLATATPAAATTRFDCRVDGDDRCIVRVVNADGGGAAAYWYQFYQGRPTDWVMLHPKQYIEDDRFIQELGVDTSEGAWDCRWDGDDKCVGRLGGTRYVFPFSDGSPEKPYISAWQG